MAVNPAPALEASAADVSARPTPDVVPSGGGYQAVVRRDGRMVWSCRHVHFTDHSARHCAEQHLAPSA